MRYHCQHAIRRQQRYRENFEADMMLSRVLRHLLQGDNPETQAARDEARKIVDQKLTAIQREKVALDYEGERLQPALAMEAK